MSKKQENKKTGIFKYSEAENPMFETNVVTNFKYPDDRSNPKASKEDVEAARDWCNAPENQK